MKNLGVSIGLAQNAPERFGSWKTTIALAIATLADGPSVLVANHSDAISARSRNIYTENRPGRDLSSRGKIVMIRPGSPATTVPENLSTGPMANTHRMTSESISTFPSG